MGCTLNSAEDCRDTPCRSCTANEPDRVQSPHKVIYLQYDPAACDEITWCNDQIDPKDTTYWRDDIVRALAEYVLSSHACCLYGTDTRAVTCLTQMHESCGHGTREDCSYFGVCTCNLCSSAREILGHVPE